MPSDAKLRAAAERVSRWNALPAFSKPSERRAVYGTATVFEAETKYMHDARILLAFACSALLHGEQPREGGGE